MNFIVNQMVQLQIIHITHRHRAVKRLAGAAVIKDSFRVLTHTGLGQDCRNIIIIRAVKNRCSHMQTQPFGGHAQVGFQNLADVHTGRYAQRVQHNLHRRAVRQERHILLRQNPGNNTFVTVTTSHFIAN